MGKWFDPFLILAFACLITFIYLFLTACGGGPVRGEVVDKQREERQDNSYWITSCSTINGNTTCAPHYVYNVDDEDWVLQVEDCTEPRKGKPCKIKRKEVSKEVFYNTEIGDWYDSSTR